MRQLLCSVWLLAAFAVAPASAAEREWRFEASLDGRPIGEHTFRVKEDGDQVEVESRASFDVRFFGFSVYTYEHRASEKWKGGCLAKLDSRTDDNGTIEVVTGALAQEGFTVTRSSGGAPDVLPACTMTFAYWNPEMRKQTRLLNPQTGRYHDVSIEDEGRASLSVDGKSIASDRYAIRHEGVEIGLWYDAAGGRWLALESRTAGGRLLTYRIAGSSMP
jgi:hypothetical protein